jgi:S1-C subfamily serine protease
VARLGFVLLSGPQRGQVTNLDRLPATVGSDPAADIVIAGSAPHHAVVFRRDGEVVLADAGSELGTWFLGTQVREVVLRNGDVVELGLDGPVVRFERGQEAVPAAATGHVSPTMVTRLVHQTSRSFRAAIAVIAVAAVLVLGWSSWQSYRMHKEMALLRAAMTRAEEDRAALEARVEEERRLAMAERKRLERRIEEYRSREESLRAQLTDAASGEVTSLAEELGSTRDRIKTLESERAAGETIIKQYGAGVCLIHGAYAFYSADERPLRIVLDEETGRPGREADGSLSVSVEGNGPVHITDYYGTGFLVDRRGTILTNRHLAEPWFGDDDATKLQKEGYRPRLLRLRGFFPQQKGPFELTFLRRDEKMDLAALRADLKGRSIPVLPLDRSRAGAVPGQPVVVVGYPAGLEALLAKAEAGIVRQLIEAHGTSGERVTEALSQRGLIRPSTTQGHIGDVTKSDIVFDAPTTQGGSGGPVFNKHGVVVAVEYAVLSQFGGNSFGIPISYALDLVEGKKAAKKP